MATPTIIEELAVLDDFEASNLDDRLWEIGGTTGDVSVSTSIVKQGSQAGAYKPGFAAAWVTGIAIEFTSSQDLSSDYLWCWYNISDKIFGNLDTIANGGLRLRIYTGTLSKNTSSDSLNDSSCNYNEYYVGGIDTLRSGWTRHVFKPSSMTPINTNGTVDLSDVTAVGFITKFSSNLTGVNSPEFWIDIFHKGPGVKFAGGTESDPIDITGILDYTEDKSRCMGIVEKYNGVFFLNGKFSLGDTGQSVYMLEDKRLFIFASHSYYDGSNVASSTGDGFHGFVNTGDDTTLKWTNHATRVADLDLVSWDLDFHTTPGTFVTIQSTLYGARNIKLCSSDYTRATFNFCDHIEANGADMDDCSFNVNIYFMISSFNTPKNIKLFYSYNGVTLGDDTVHLSNYTFDNCTSEITHYSSGTLTIYQEDGTEIDPTKINESGGGNTVLYNKRTKTFTGLPENTEARVVQGAYTLDHEASVTGGEYEYTYDVSDDPARALFVCPGYVIDPVNFTLDTNNSTIAVTAKPDPSYS